MSTEESTELLPLVPKTPIHPRRPQGGRWWWWAIVFAYWLLTIAFLMLIFFSSAVAYWTKPEVRGYLDPFTRWIMLSVLTGWCLIGALIHLIAPVSWYDENPEYGYWYSDMHFWYYILIAVVAGILFGTELDLWRDFYSTNTAFLNNDFANSIVDARQNTAFILTYTNLLFIMVGTGGMVLFSWLFRKRIYDLAAYLVMDMEKKTTLKSSTEAETDEGGEVIEGSSSSKLKNRKKPIGDPFEH
jgi:hypothetical protein